jgi:hypothetical protein
MRKRLNPYAVALAAGLCSLLSILYAGPAAGRTSKAAASDITAAQAQLSGLDQLVGGAGQYVQWELASEDLQAAIAADPQLSSRYSSAVSALNDLDHLPDTDVTPAEDAKGATDQSVLDNALGSSPYAALNGEAPSGRYYRAASILWFGEPTDRSGSLKVADIKSAISELQIAVARRSRGAAAFPAAIVDLRDLESARKSEVELGPTNRYWLEIDFLNGFFGPAMPRHAAVLSRG